MYVCMYVTVLSFLPTPVQAIKHLVKFVTFDDHDLYTGVNFKKLLGAPSQYCFCLRV